MREEELPREFVDLRSMISSDLKQMRRIERKSPIYAVALLVLVATEALSHLEGRGDDAVFAEELLARRHGVPVQVGRMLFDLIRNGLAHLYDTKIIRLRGTTIVIVLSWQKVPHMSRATADWLRDGVQRPGLCLNVGTMVIDLYAYFENLEQRLRADPTLVAAVERNGARQGIPGDRIPALEGFLQGCREVTIEEEP